MSEHARPVLDYMGRPDRECAQINIPGVISISSAVLAILFLLATCAGIWQTYLPFIGARIGMIEIVLGAVAVIGGAVGALQASRDSRWYNISLIGYATGVFIWTLCPVFFML